MQSNRYNRRGSVERVGIMAAVVLMPCCLFAYEDSKKVDIVLFVSDDHGYADSGIYGDSHVNTPNIDRLARESMRFTRAFAASPLCSPSRCVIETGLMPHRNGGHKFGTHTGNDNGGPGIANHCPARTIRSATHRYVFNLAPETTFTTHITGCKTGPHYLPHWDSWGEKARTNEKAARIVQAYQHRPREELFDIEKDPHEMNNLADKAEYAPQKMLLRRQLAQWCNQQGDTVAAEALLELDAPMNANE